MKPPTLFCRVLIAELAVLVGIARGQEAGANKDREAVERYQQAVEKNPRRGAALDRLYGIYVERGTVDVLRKIYADRATQNPSDGVAWLLMGLIDLERGREADAEIALNRAAETRKTDPMPPYYRGLALVQIGRTDDAIAAFEEAIARKPSRIDAIAIHNTLGKLLLRAQRFDKALAVWARLEALLPGDVRVREEAAGLLADEGQTAPALERWQALARDATDPGKRLQYQLEAADLKIRSGKRDDAIRDYESVLARLNPESWLYRETRRRVEETFLKNDDQVGLAKYYDSWLAKNPDDLDAMARQARALALAGKPTEARAKLTQAIKLAPTRRDLRLALIEQWVREEKFAEAADQYRELAATDPANPDTLKAWGAMLLKDNTKPPAERKKAAADVWMKLVELKPKDPVNLVQVADLFRRNELSDRAIDLHQRAIAAAPNSPQYLEYLGEYYHSLKRSDEALATWNRIAAGAKRDVQGLTRLAQVLGSFGYLEPARQAAADAIALDPKDFRLRMLAADLASRSDLFKEALAALQKAAPLADSEEEKSSVIEEEIAAHRAMGDLPEAIREIEAELKANPRAAASAWVRLAKFEEAGQDFDGAESALRKAIALDPKLVSARTSLARVLETKGDLTSAVDALRALAGLDRRFKTESLQRAAELELRMGKIDRAIAAANELIAAAPGNGDPYEFLAGIYFRSGRMEEGFETLRRAIRAIPNEVKLVGMLADALAQEYRTDEAIEMYWRAFDKSNDLDDRLALIPKLAGLYDSRDQLDSLLARLDRELAEPEQQKPLAFLKAQAFAVVGEIGSARRILEKLLETDSNDLDLLRQLIAIADQEGDFTSAAVYQKQANGLNPTDQGASALAQYYLQAGETSEAQAVWEAAAEQNIRSTLVTLDYLLGMGEAQAAVGLIDKIAAKREADWELMYRKATALWKLGNRDGSRALFRSILELDKLVDDTPSVLGFAGPSRAVTRDSSVVRQYYQRYLQALQTPGYGRYSALIYIRRITGIAQNVFFMQNGRAWSPADFGQARMAAIAFLLSDSTQNRGEDAFVAELEDRARRAPGDAHAWADLLYLHMLREKHEDAYQSARAWVRAAPTDPTAAWLLIHTLANRTGMSMYGATLGHFDSAPQLEPDERALLVKAERLIVKTKPGTLRPWLINTLDHELRRCGSAAEGDMLLEDLRAAASEPGVLAGITENAAERGDIERTLELMQRVYQTPYIDYHITLGQYGIDQPIARLMNALAYQDRHAEIVQVIDRQWASARVRSTEFRNRRRSGLASIRRRSRSASAIVYSWVGYGFQGRSMNLPKAADDFDENLIAVLYNAYLQLDGVGKLTLLTDAIEAKARAAADDLERVQAEIALAAIAVWRKDNAAGIRMLELAASHSSDQSLKLQIAELLIESGKPAEALAAIDQIEPRDPAVLRERELKALALATKLGKADRAKKAVTRLYSLNIDAETKSALAEQMEQLGMHEQAETLLARLQRESGGRSIAVVHLMRQYVREKKSDDAVRIAMDILKRPAISSVASSSRDDSAARTEAVQVLVKAGKLDLQVARFQEQARLAPRAATPRENLFSVLVAARRYDEARRAARDLAALRSDHAGALFDLGGRLSDGGDAAGAFDLSIEALRSDASIANDPRLSSVFNNGRKLGRLDELVKTLEATDFRGAGGSPFIMIVISRLINDPAQKPAAMRLVRKVWEQVPRARVDLVGEISDPDFFKGPQIYEGFRDSVFPGPDHLLFSEWDGFDRAYKTDYDRDQGGLSLLHAIAKAAGRERDLKRDLEVALRRVPGWKAGAALHAVVSAELGDSAFAKPVLEGLLFDAKSPSNKDVLRMIAPELEPIAELGELHVRTLERLATTKGGSDPILFLSDPMAMLARAHHNAGADETARIALWTCADGSAQHTPGAFRTDAYMITNELAMAQAFGEAGYDGDAIRLLNRAALLETSIMHAQTLQNTTTASGGGSVVDFGELIPRLRREAESRWSSPSAAAKSLRGWMNTGEKTKPAVDLALLCVPLELDGIDLRCLWLEAAARLPERDRPAIRALLDAKSAAAPEDLSSLVAAALCSQAWRDRDRLARDLGALDALLGKLEPAESIAKTATIGPWSAWVGLSVLARELRDEKPELADRLAGLALDQADRCDTPIWALAMLRERAVSAHARGDAKSLEDALAKMLERLSGPLVATAGDKARKTATIQEFERFAQFARLSTKLGRGELGLTGLAECLKRGMPLEPFTQSQDRIPITYAKYAPPLDPQATPHKIADRIHLLHSGWVEARVKPELVTRCLRALVFSEGTERALLWYPVQAPKEGSSRPTSVGELLVLWTIAAGETESLRSLLRDRASAPANTAVAELLLCRLAIAAREPASARASLKNLGKLLGGRSARDAAEPAYHAIVAALEVPELEREALALAELWSANRALRATGEWASGLNERLGTFLAARGAKDAASGKLHEAYDALANAQTPASEAEASAIKERNAIRAFHVYSRSGLWSDAIDTLATLALDKSRSPDPRGVGDALAELSAHLETLEPEAAYRMLASRFENNVLAGVVNPAAKAVSADPGSGVISSAGLMARAQSRSAGKRERAGTPEAKGFVAQYLEARKLAFDSKTAESGTTALRELRASLANDRDLWRASIDRDLAIAATEPGAFRPRAFEHWRLESLDDQGIAGGWQRNASRIMRTYGYGSEAWFFEYPLSGSFTITLEASASPGAEGHVALAGLGFEPMSPGPPHPKPSSIVIPWDRSPTWPFGVGGVRVLGSSLIQPIALAKPREEGFRKIVLEADAQKGTKCMIAGEVFFEDRSPSASSPWFALLVDRDRKAELRNITIQGEPTIPESVSLIAGDRLDGWIPRSTGDRIARRVGDRPLKFPGFAELDDDWSVRSGVLLGRRNAPARSFEPETSVLRYARPLFDGETVSYEFFYEPDRIAGDPVLGDLTLALEPAGAAIRDWRRPERVLDARPHRRGPSALPLKKGDWNRVTLSIRQSTLALALNETLILEMPIDPESSRRFGFAHHADSEIRVRNVVLRGDWPKTLKPSIRANLLGPPPKD